MRLTQYREVAGAERIAYFSRLDGTRSASEQCPARDGNAERDDDGEPEHGIGCACTLVESNSGSDNWDREPYEERDE